MKRLVGLLCVAAFLVCVPTGRAEAGTIYVGFLDFYEDDPFFGPYIDVVNDSHFDLTPFYDHQPGAMDSLTLTIETTGGPSQFVYGREIASGGSCTTNSAADFFAAGSACVEFEPIPFAASARFLFNAAGISILDFVSATLAFEFEGIQGDAATVDFDAFTVELTATRQASPAPEPGVLLLLGAAAAALARRRRRQSR